MAWLYDRGTLVQQAVAAQFVKDGTKVRPGISHFKWLQGVAEVPGVPPRPLDRRKRRRAGGHRWRPPRAALRGLRAAAPGARAQTPSPPLLRPTRITIASKNRAEHRHPGAEGGHPGGSNKVRAPGGYGSFGVLPGHTPFLTVMLPGELMYRVGSSTSYFAVGEGFIEVENDTVSVLAETAEPAGDINADRARKAMADAQAKMKGLSPDDPSTASKPRGFSARRRAWRSPPGPGDLSRAKRGPGRAPSAVGFRGPCRTDASPDCPGRSASCDCHIDSPEVADFKAGRGGGATPTSPLNSPASTTLPPRRPSRRA